MQRPLPVHAPDELVEPISWLPASDAPRANAFAWKHFTHYRDHAHPAPELYWILSGPSEWKRGEDGFMIRQAGETIGHEAGVVQATRTLEQPLLALWAWTGDADGPVTLVPG